MKPLSDKFTKFTVFIITKADHFPFILVALPALIAIFTDGDFFIRLLLAGWIIVAYVFFLVAKAKNKVIDNFIKELNEQDIQLEATTRINERLMEAMSNIDKNILSKYGITISIEKKKTVH